MSWTWFFQGLISFAALVALGILMLTYLNGYWSKKK